MRLAHLKGVEFLLALGGAALVLVSFGSMSAGWVFQSHPALFAVQAKTNTSGGNSNGSAIRILGRLEIPRLHVSTLIVEGAEDDSLRLGIGHVPGTALPGEMGNVGLAAHRDTFFRSLRNIKIGEHIVIDGDEGARLDYTIESRRIVAPEDVSVLASSDTGQVTLITCYPFGFVGDAPNRLVLTGRVGSPL